jgi:hypothetical protein
MSLLLRAAKGLGNGGSSDWVPKQLKKALNPQNGDAVEI